MRGSLFVTVGLVMETLAALTFALAHHDGLIGATPWDAFPGPGDGPGAVTARIVIDGPVDTDEPLLDGLEPAALGGPEATEGRSPGKLMFGRFDPPAADALLLVSIRGDAPGPGQAIVVHGVAQTYRVGTADAPDLSFVVVLRSDEIRQPILF